MGGGGGLGVRGSGLEGQGGCKRRIEVFVKVAGGVLGGGLGGFWGVRGVGLGGRDGCE